MTRAARIKRTARGVVATLALTASLAACVPGGGAPPPSPSCAPTATTSAIFNHTNNARRFFKLPTFAWNGQLACLAKGWSEHMAATNRLVHRDLNAAIRLPQFANLRTMGENILYGPQNMPAKGMYDLWMGSPGHRANILKRAFTKIGIGVAYGHGRVWATQNFGG